ncbi:MAG: hypothetical protein HQK81_10890 [Desulfovibrionaceae bacterium]|nr:hypothetical protein [Desulfovibrionaceae bacterium]MBF0514547.1 hypothetical protein [Desulfovibrionaceae bacterium]
MTAQTATITALKERIAPAPVPAVSVGLTDSESFALAQRVARMFSESMLVPKAFQGAIGNCVIALNMASRMGADPLMVMQNLYVVHGTPAWSAQFMIATFNACGRFSSIRYEFKGDEAKDDWSCRAWAIEKDTGERIEGAWVSIGLAKKEGWHGKNGSKWQTMPQQMLQYRAASWFIRAYAPEISMGLRTADEVRDTYDMEESEDGAFTVKVEDMKPVIEATPETADPKKTKKEPAQAEAEYVTCPYSLDEEEKPIKVNAKACDHCQKRAGCPTWQK